MKYLKTYEDINRLPKLNDWVIIADDLDVNINNDSIGQIIKIYPNKRYIIKFDKIDRIPTLGVDQLKYWSDNIKELEILINSKKYNI